MMKECPSEKKITHKNIFRSLTVYNPSRTDRLRISKVANKIQITVWARERSSINQSSIKKGKYNIHNMTYEIKTKSSQT